MPSLVHRPWVTYPAVELISVTSDYRGTLHIGDKTLSAYDLNAWHFRRRRHLTSNIVFFVLPRDRFLDLGHHDPLSKMVQQIHPHRWKFNAVFMPEQVMQEASGIFNLSPKESPKSSRNDKEINVNTSIKKRWVRRAPGSKRQWQN